jgi:hypothetical protein
MHTYADISIDTLEYVYRTTYIDEWILNVHVYNVYIYICTCLYTHSYIHTLNIPSRHTDEVES